MMRRSLLALGIAAAVSTQAQADITIAMAGPVTGPVAQYGDMQFSGARMAIEQINAAGGKVELSVDGSYQQKPDVAIVVFGEDPYAEGHGDRENLDYQRGEKTDLALLKKLKALIVF